MLTSKPFPTHSHLTHTQVKQIINQTFVNQSFKKHMNNVVLKNAQRKISPESVSYVNSMMDRLVIGSSIRPSDRVGEREEECEGPMSQIMRVRMVRKGGVMRMSVIQFGDSEERKGQTLYKSQKKKVLQKINGLAPYLHIPLTTKRSQSNPITLTQQPRHTIKKLLKHQRTSTQSNYPQNPSTSILQQTLLPITNMTQQSTSRSDSKQSHLNQQLEHHIESLRNRKLKLEAAFINFDNNGQGRGDRDGHKKERQGMEKKGTLVGKMKREGDGMYKPIVTNYDGEVINCSNGTNSVPMQKLKRINFFNKQNHFNSGSFAPTVRIKTQISSNFLQIHQNTYSFKPTYTKPNTKKKFLQSAAMFSSMLHSHSSSSTSKKASICSVEEGEGKGMEDRFGQRKNIGKIKQTRNELFMVENLTRSKRMIEKDVKRERKREVCVMEP